MKTYTYTNQKQLRKAFFETFPELPRRRHRYSWGQGNKSDELIHHVDTRCAFVNWIDSLQRTGEISEALALRATL